MADLHTVNTFIDNADAHTAFLDRVRVAVYEAALNIRENPVSPQTAVGEAKERWALSVFSNPTAEAKRMLPALAIKANNAGLIDDNGNIAATDTQIRNTVNGLIDEYTDYIAPVA